MRFKSFQATHITTTKMRNRAASITAVVLFCLVAADLNGHAVYAQTVTPKPKFTAYQRTELFFGLDKPTGGTVTAEEWEKFVAYIVTPRFPDGFTVDDALGQYLDGKILVREKSKQLILIYPRKLRTSSSRKIEEIRAAYIKAFDQKSVLRVDLSTYVLVSF
jgi:hypothetical protein